MNAVVDAHVRIGTGREAALSADELEHAMARLGIDQALISPAERHLAVAEREGNRLVASLSASSEGRLHAYAVANPWRGRAALHELAAAHELGAVALAFDPAIQGFDLLDGQIDPLIESAIERGWPIYVRCGTPAFALPLQLAELAVRHPQAAFIMGKCGATDFWLDARPAMQRAENLYADTSHSPWDVVLDPLIAPPVSARRVVFATDAPYTTVSLERTKVDEWPLSAADRAAVKGNTILRLIGR